VTGTPLGAADGDPRIATAGGHRNLAIGERPHPRRVLGANGMPRWV
jgi:hypothetical protein